MRPAGRRRRDAGRRPRHRGRRRRAIGRRTVARARLPPPAHASRRVTAEEPIAIDDLRGLVPGRFRDFVKRVVDLRRGGHAHRCRRACRPAAALLAKGSNQRDLRGINLYPQLAGPDWLEFDSMINLRPSFGNRSRTVDDPARHRQSPARLRESARAREVVVDFVDGPSGYQSTAEGLQRYFDASALAARRSRERL